MNNWRDGLTGALLGALSAIIYLATPIKTMSTLPSIAIMAGIGLVLGLTIRMIKRSMTRLS